MFRLKTARLNWCSAFYEAIKKKWEWSILAIASLFVIFRAPGILFQGRFWAEDGVIYFLQAYVSGDALKTFLSTDLGYYSIVNRFAGYVSANWISIENAPLIHCWMALIFMLLPVFVLLFSEAPGIETPLKKIIGVFLVLVVSPNLETWLSLALSHFHLSLAVALIMISKSDCRWVRWVRYITLALAGLNTPLPGFFVPFFWIAWFFDKNSTKLNEAVLLTLFAGIQAWIVLSIPSYGERYYLLSFSFLPYSLMVKQFLLSFLGWTIAECQVQELRTLFQQGSWKYSWIVYLIYGAISYLIIRFKDKVAGLLFVSGIFVLIISVISDLGISSPEQRIIYIDVMIGGRYFFIPNMLFFFSLLVLSRNQTDYLGRSVSTVLQFLLIWVVLCGFLNYRPDPKFSDEFFVGPSWSVEVEKWREEPSYFPHIWPERKAFFLPPPEQAKP